MCNESNFDTSERIHSRISVVAKKEDLYRQMKKNVYMYQPNYLYGKDAYLPYAVGALAAYAWSNDLVNASYDLKAMGYIRSPIKSVVDSLEYPFLCAFSCYTWNYQYNKALARAIKEAYPMCKVIFGGHQISRQYKDESEEFADIFIYDEGEVPFKEILIALESNSDLSKIPNIKYKELTGEWRFTPQVPIEVIDFPSPYLTGVFNSLMEKSRFNFTPTFETNRGCPFSCAYCDWGGNISKLRQFPMERIKAEIDWFSEHKIDLIFGADSNFGILERDEEIIDYMIFKKKATGYPHKFRVSYTKNTGNRVFSINQKLNKVGMCKGATLSFQSLNERTLEAIGRKNIPLEYFSELMDSYNRESIPTYSEIILGLPEETFKSFCMGIDQLLESGQHTSINIYLCELLPNSIMGGSEYINKYRIQAADTVLNQYHCVALDGDVTERSKIVTGTSSLTFTEWKKSYYYSLIIQTFHCLGLTRYIAIYLHCEKNIPYHIFYENLLDWCIKEPNTVAGKALLRMIMIFERYIDGTGSLQYVDPRFGNIIWPLDEAWYLEVLYEYELFYTELNRHLSKEYPELVTEEFAQLCTYQKSVVYVPNTEYSEINLNFDFPEYFSEIMSGSFRKLKSGQYSYKAILDERISKWDEFATKVVWYGRKGGKNHLKYERQ